MFRAFLDMLTANKTSKPQRETALWLGDFTGDQVNEIWKDWGLRRGLPIMQHTIDLETLASIAVKVQKRHCPNGPVAAFFDELTEYLKNRGVVTASLQYVVVDDASFNDPRIQALFEGTDNNLETVMRARFSMGATSKNGWRLTVI